MVTPVMSISWKLSRPSRLTANVAGDGNHGNGIHVCGGDTSDQVGSARSGGSHADADLSGGSRVAVRRVGSSLLVGGQDVT